MHVRLWDAKGSELFMRPIIQQFRDKGIPQVGTLAQDLWPACTQKISLLVGWLGSVRFNGEGRGKHTED